MIHMIGGVNQQPENAAGIYGVRVRFSPEGKAILQVLVNNSDEHHTLLCAW